LPVVDRAILAAAGEILVRDGFQNMRCSAASSSVISSGGGRTAGGRKGSSRPSGRHSPP